MGTCLGTRTKNRIEIEYKIFTLVTSYKPTKSLDTSSTFNWYQCGESLLPNYNKKESQKTRKM